MNKNNIAITDSQSVCFNCLKSAKIREIEIGSMGWGSCFDGWSTNIKLCDDCIGSTNLEWWELRVVEGETEQYGSSYEFEDEIFEYVNKMPLAGQELFWNRYSYGNNGNWEPQDYIDYQLGILPHEKCKEYGVYSHDEIKAYRDRFPICQHPIHVVYNDDSVGCRCPFGAFGKSGQLTDAYNISDECYECNHFTERTTFIKDVPDKDYNDYKIYYKAKLMQEVYKNKFE